MHPYLTIYTQSSPTSTDVPPSTLLDIDQRLMHDWQVPTLFPSCYSPYANVYAECILHCGESVCGEAHECISVVPDSQKSVWKSNKLHPAPAQCSESSTTIPWMSMSTTVVPQPTSSENPPALNDTPMSTLKAEAREALQWYFLLQQPMWMKQDDDLYICNLADDLAKKYIPEPHK